MRVLCVGRHAFLSEHLSRYFCALGAQCEAVTGTGEVPALAREFEPNIVVCDSELLTPALMDAWGEHAALAEAAVLAVSLTRRPEESTQPAPDAGVIYLPALDRDQALGMLAAAYQPRGVRSPLDWRTTTPTSALSR